MSKIFEVVSELLGDDFYEELNKFELIKQNTQTAVDPEEVETALRIVPKAVMAWLIKNLGEMQISESKELKLPFSKADGASLQLTKIDNDVYSGEINKDGQKVTKFLYRPLPSIGLILLTTFEMYDIDTLSQYHAQPKAESETENKVQALIEERIALKDLVNKVVDKKMAERDAVEAMVLNRLKTATVVPEIVKPKKELKLKKFMDKLSEKKKHSIKMEKSESFHCPDCGKMIFDQKGFSGCVCFGEDMNKSVSLLKSGDGLKISFSKGWEKENEQMLLKILRKQEDSDE